MNKKKAITIICICIVVVLVAGAVIQGLRIYNREKDPYWQVAKKLYNVENALKEVDEDWELESLSTVTPYTYTNSEELLQRPVEPVPRSGFRPDHLQSGACRPDLRWRRCLPDALQVRALRPEPDERHALWHCACGSRHRRPEGHRASL